MKFFLTIVFALCAQTVAAQTPEGHKPLLRLDLQKVQKFLPYIEKSVDVGMPSYDFNYRLTSLGDFETERTGPVIIYQMIQTESVELVKTKFKVYTYEVQVPFQGDEGSTGALMCHAYVTENEKTLELGFKPAFCELYYWDDEGLREE